MLRDGYYYPSDEDRRLFNRLVTTVSRNPDRFAASGAALDRDYSTQAIRDRQAAELREYRASPDHIKRSRAFQRKHCQHEALSQQLGFTVTPLEVIPGPPKRLKGAGGKPQQPEIALRERFAFAFEDRFEVEIDLAVHELQESLDVAAKRVLLAWLRLDPNRGTVRHITEFQDLRSKPTDEGIGPLWVPDETELTNSDEVLYVRRDGGMTRDAKTWIAMAKEALEFLESQPDLADTLNMPTLPRLLEKSEASSAAPAAANHERHDGPYPYGSDLHWLLTWAERIDQWMMEGTLPNRHLQGIFQPDRSADQAITRLSDRHPQAFGLIQADLADVQCAYDGQNGSDAKQQDLLESMTRLRDRIRTVAKMVAGGEPDKNNGQRDDGKVNSSPELKVQKVAQGGMAWREAVTRAEKHVKAHDGAFPSVKQLAEIVGCSRPTMDKAIRKSTYLKARKAQKAQSARTVPLTDMAIEAVSEQSSREDELAKLIEEQQAELVHEDRQEKAAQKRRA